MNKILISATPFAEFDALPLEKLRKAGFEPILSPYGCYATPSQSIELLVGISGLVAGIEPLNRDVLEASKLLKVISRVGIGLDSIDLIAAKDLDIKIHNTPDAPTQAVAELTLGLILTIMRQITKNDRQLRSKKWTQNPGHLLKGKNIGLVGLGRIGRRLVKLLEPFEPIIFATDIKPPEDFIKSHNIRFYPQLHDILPQVDILSLHIPHVDKGYLIGPNELNIMKKGSFLINTARGKLINEGALLEALHRKQVAGAALDVFEKEPYFGLLAKEENVVLTSHIGSYSVESRIQMENEAVDNLLMALTERK